MGQDLMKETTFEFRQVTVPILSWFGFGYFLIIFFFIFLSSMCHILFSTSYLFFISSLWLPYLFQPRPFSVSYVVLYI